MFHLNWNQKEEAVKLFAQGNNWNFFNNNNNN